MSWEIKYGYDILLLCWILVSTWINEFRDRIVKGTNFAYPGMTPEDVNGHGTHVAGIIAALQDDLRVTGVAPDARIMPVRVV